MGPPRASTVETGRARVAALRERRDVIHIIQYRGTLFYD
jgi:hypothetical protein